MTLVSIRASKAAPHTIELFGKVYTFTASTTATRAEAVASILRKAPAKRTKRDRAELVRNIHITTLTGKLEGLRSITTSTLENDFCGRCRNTCGAICEKCYAVAELSSGIRQTLTEHSTINGWILKNQLFTVPELRDIPFMYNEHFFRLESHGETQSETQARNYIRIAKANRSIRFGVWSKNSPVWAAAFKAEGKPKNLLFVLSSLFIGKPITPPPAIAPYIDHIFTVYAKETAHPIQCGGTRCADCIKAKKHCYFAPSESNPVHIAERLK